MIKTCFRLRRKYSLIIQSSNRRKCKIKNGHYRDYNQWYIDYFKKRIKLTLINYNTIS